MAASDDAAVLAAARRLVASAREVVESYAGPVAPVRTDQVGALLAAFDCHVEVFPFHSDTVAMVLPRCGGVYPVLVNRAAEQTDRFFALRHELGHVLNGDVDGAVFLADEGYMSGAERVADLFALADLVPGWWISELRRGRTPWREVRREIAMAVAAYAEAWPAQRFGDRAELRLALFREHGI
jgi:hypothetical protein